VEVEKNLNQARLEFHQPEAASWDAVFGAANKILLNYSLNPAQKVRAKQVVLMKGIISGAEKVSLHDVIQRQNVQGRLEFFNCNFAFVEQQVRQYVASIGACEPNLKHILLLPLNQTCTAWNSLCGAITADCQIQSGSNQAIKSIPLKNTRALAMNGKDCGVWVVTDKQLIQLAGRARFA
jgi:hypothetical protein